MVQRARWFVLWLSFLVQPLAGNEPSTLDELSLDEMEGRLLEIDSELEELANLTLRTGVGNFGWSSKGHHSGENTEWVHIDLEDERTVDQIVLVPAIWRDTHFGPQADAFPREFEVLVGLNGDQEGEVVASFGPEDKIFARIAPLVIPIPPVTASWIRVRATSLSRTAVGGGFAFRLSEIMVFGGEENWALHRPVAVSSTRRSRVRYSLLAEALVDGFLPYVIDTAQGEASRACVIFYQRELKASIETDLGESVPVNQIRLHAADVSESVPQIQHADYAFPKHLLLEGAHQADFSDAFELLNFRRETIYSTGPFVTVQFPEMTCRYVRISFLEGYRSPEARDVWRCVGFAEVELFSRGSNFLRGKEMSLKIGNGSLEEGVNLEGDLAAMTDGRNHFGSILPIRKWVEQLGRRHDLEVERPFVEEELRKRYGRQESLLKFMRVAVILLAIGIVLTFLIDRILRMRQVARIKKRFGADLHDEVGANLHAIALLSDMIQQKVKDEELSDMVEEVRTISLETTEATQHCTSMLEAKGICEDLAGELKRVAGRMLVDLDHEMEIEGEEHLQLLSPKRRIDLLLFYKESLANIVRHSQATKVTTRIAADSKNIDLVVSDNGVSFLGGIPSSLRRRARLVRAKVEILRPEGAGTSIALKTKTRRFAI